MIIHVVQPGETISTIADYYNISESRLIQENGIINPEALVIGQTIVIVYPNEIYIVKEGDTLAQIAAANNITLRALLRNNPFLSERDFIYPGETLIISYVDEKIYQLTTSGFAYPYIDKRILRKTLPFLTYLTIFNYQVTFNGDIIDIDDTEIIQIAKDYKVAPIMLLSTLSPLGIGSEDVSYNILHNPPIQDKVINNTLDILKRKGYYGLNVYLQFFRRETQNLVEFFLDRLITRLNSEGYPVIVTLVPELYVDTTTITFERLDYTKLGEIANGILFLTYSWGYTYGPPAAVTSVTQAREFLDYVITQIPPSKMYTGIPVIGYDWPLPYIEGVTRANAISSDAAILLAVEVEAIIKYDETAEAPFFQYLSYELGMPIEHIVWFKDARSIDEIMRIVPEYGFIGTNIWNIMQFFAQMWLIINTQYEIETILNLDNR